MNGVPVADVFQNFKEMGVDFSMEKNKQGSIVFANCAPPPRRRTDDDETCETINAIFTKVNGNNGNLCK